MKGNAPRGLHVRGHLNLADCRDLLTLPRGLSATSIDLSGSVNLRELPHDLTVGRLNVNGCSRLRDLPDGLRCFELSACNTRLRTLPSSLQVTNRLDLSGCTELMSLPDNLKVGTLVLRECVSLLALPEGLDTHFLDISGCTRLTAWPRRACVRIGRLNARGCTRLASLPPWLTHVAQLDISGCSNLQRLPETLVVSSWIDVAHTGLTELPPQLQSVPLRWRGVPITPRIAFEAETLTADEVLAQPNAELRRVLLERLGYGAFLATAQAITLDQDEDPGGERRLLKVPLKGDEDLVCVAVYCPSTGRQYLIRVPPTMRSCRQAVAWIAGFDNPDDYQPLVET
ncbi:MAG TPA: hypothetical protein VGD69_05685 [Herpetosiphonaceae bacterium]